MYDNRQIVADFIEEVWNKQRLEKVEEFLHPDFRDYSLPLSFAPDRTGLVAWVAATSSAFEHRTTIEEQITEGDKSVVRITMTLKHIGLWREIPATGITATAPGYRLFRLADGKIVEHRGAIDGAAIESQLRGDAHGCALLR